MHLLEKHHTEKNKFRYNETFSSETWSCSREQSHAAKENETIAARQRIDKCTDRIGIGALRDLEGHF